MNNNWLNSICLVLFLLATSGTFAGTGKTEGRNL
jgi:hypothetical protein